MTSGPRKTASPSTRQSRPKAPGPRPRLQARCRCAPRHALPEPPRSLRVPNALCPEARRSCPDGTRKGCPHRSSSSQRGARRRDIPFYVHRVASYWNDVGSLSEYRQGNFDALQGKVRLEPEGTEVAPGVRAGERTYISPEASVEGPVLLGRDCRVEGDAVLRGPLVIGDYCVIEAGALLESSVLWGGVLVGPRAQIRDSIVASHTSVWPEARVVDSVVGERCGLLEAAAIERSLVDVGSLVEAGEKVVDEGLA